MGAAVVSAAQAGASALAGMGQQAEAVAGKIGLIKREASGLSGMWDENGNLTGGGNGGGGTYRAMDTGEFALMARAESLGGLELRKEMERELAEIGKRAAPGGVGLAGANPRYAEMVNDIIVKRLDQIQIEQERASGRYETNKPRIVDQQPREQVTTYRVQVSTGAGRSTTINTASKQDAEAVIDLFRQIENDSMRA